MVNGLHPEQCAFRPKRDTNRPRMVYSTTRVKPTTYLIDYDLSFSDYEVFVPADEKDFLGGSFYTKYGMWCETIPTGVTGQFSIRFPGIELPRWVKLPDYEVGMEIIEIRGEYAGRRGIIADTTIHTGNAKGWITEDRHHIREEFIARIWPENVPFEQILGAKHQFPIGTRVEFPDSQLLLRPGVVVGYKHGRAKVLDLLTSRTMLIHPVELKPYVEREPMKKGSVPPAVKPKGRATLRSLPKGKLPPKGKPSED